MSRPPPPRSGPAATTARSSASSAAPAGSPIGRAARWRRRSGADQFHPLEHVCRRAVRRARVEARARRAPRRGQPPTPGRRSPRAPPGACPARRVRPGRGAGRSRGRPRDRTRRLGVLGQHPHLEHAEPLGLASRLPQRARWPGRDHRLRTRRARPTRAPLAAPRACPTPAKSSASPSSSSGSPARRRARTTSSRAACCQRRTTLLGEQPRGRARPARPQRPGRRRGTLRAHT